MEVSHRGPALSRVFCKQDIDGEPELLLSAPPTPGQVPMLRGPMPLILSSPGACWGKR